MSQLQRIISVLIIILGSGSAILYFGPYTIDTETWVVEVSHDQRAHHLVGGSFFALGDQLGASYTLDGAVIIWRKTPFRVERIVPITHYERLKLSWEGDTLHLHTTHQRYTFTLNQGLSEPKHSEPLPPAGWELSDTKEIEQHHLPVNTREYKVDGSTVYGLTAAGDLFKQSGRYREVIPASLSGCHIQWSPQGVLVGVNPPDGEESNKSKTRLIWSPKDHKEPSVSWSVPLSKRLLWSPELTEYNLLAEPRFGSEVMISSFNTSLPVSRPPKVMKESGWNMLCSILPPLQKKETQGLPLRVDNHALWGLNASGHFSVSAAQGVTKSTLTQHRFTSLTCAPDHSFAIGLTHTQELHIIKMATTLLVDVFPKELKFDIYSPHIALNSAQELGISNEKGFHIISLNPNQPTRNFKLSARYATSSPDGQHWVVIDNQSQLWMINSGQQPQRISGPRSPSRVAWPHPQVITWEGIDAGIIIAPSSGDFMSSKRQLIHYRANTHTFEKISSDGQITEMKNLSQLFEL